MQYYVQVLEKSKKGFVLKIVKQIGPLGEVQAERTEEGLKRNLNREKYWTRVVDEEDLK